MNDADESRRVAEIMQGYITRFRELIADSSLEDTQLKAHASALKQEIRSEHRRMSSPKFVPNSLLEQVFLVPAIRNANAEFSMRTIVSPTSNKWRVGLNAVRGEFSYHLARLLDKHPEAAENQTR